MPTLPSAEVSRDISPNDEMHVAGNESHYFRVGQSALECINCSLQAARLPAGNSVASSTCPAVTGESCDI